MDKKSFFISLKCCSVHTKKWHSIKVRKSLKNFGKYFILDKNRPNTYSEISNTHMAWINDLWYVLDLSFYSTCNVSLMKFDIWKWMKKGQVKNHLKLLCWFGFLAWHFLDLSFLRMKLFEYKTGVMNVRNTWH